MGAGHDHGHAHTRRRRAARRQPRTAGGCGSRSSHHAHRPGHSRSSAVCSPTRWRCSPTPATWRRTRSGSAWRCSRSTSRTGPPSERRTFGFARAEILAALANCLLLLGVGGYHPLRGDRALHHPAETEGGLTVVFGADRPGRERHLARPADARPEGEPQRAGRLPGGARGRAGLAGGAHLGGGHHRHRLAGRRPDRLAGDRR